MRRIHVHHLRRLTPSVPPSFQHHAVAGTVSSSTSRPLHTRARLDSSSQLATSASAAGPGPGTGDAAAVPSALRDIWARRKAAGPLNAGIAAPSHSDMFKAPTTGKPMAHRWESHLSKESLAREPCNLKNVARHLKKPGLISLGGGLPSSQYFPFSALDISAVSPATNFSEAGALDTLSIGKYDASAPPVPIRSPSPSPASPSPTAAPQPEYDLSIALNYAQCIGSAQLLRFVTEHVELVHAPPYADWRCAATIGSTGALEQVLRMLCDRARADAVVTDEFSFATALETLAPLGIKAVGVLMDHEGLVPAALDEMLASWDQDARGGTRKPHVLYTVPSGQNPTGATQGVQRRRDLYAVCQKHNLMIIEDEPYYFLQFPPFDPSSSSPSSPSTPPPPPLSTSSYLASLLPSLLSMDTDGRVIRLDSFSKTLVPGSRAGWLTAPAQLVDRFVMHSEVANQGPAGFSQLVLHRLLDESWGHQGFLRWLAHLGREYARRRDVLVRACEQFLPRDVVSWVPPRAGMFIWLKINHKLHPSAGSLDILALEQAIFKSCIEKGVLVAPGSFFHAEKDRPLPGLFFRATFAAASEENMAEAVRRFGQAVRESFGLE